MKTQNLLLLPALFSAAAVTTATTASAAKSDRPNVLVILVDDLGYGDLGCYGATLIKTPNIDKLASEGRRFTDAHSPSAVSTPSRYSLLTGRYPFRGSIPGASESGIWGPLALDTPLIIEEGVETIADMMKAMDYNTACIGKWHLGFQRATTDWTMPLGGPTAVGFDYYFGVPLVNSGSPFVYVENDQIYGGDPSDPLLRIEKGETPTATQKHPNKGANQYKGAVKAHELYKDDEGAEMLLGKATAWLDENKDEPFFMYYAPTHIHHPFTPSERFQGSSGAGIYGDYLQEFDWVVGELMAYLESEGLADNTYVVFTSDNGGMFNNGGQAAFKLGHYINGSLLGFKFSVWEGGHRVPCIMRWPGHIKANTVSDQTISNIDIFATVASITGYELADGVAPDSYDVSKAITGNPRKNVRDHLILSSFKSTHVSLRMGDWMYIPMQNNGGWVQNKPGNHIFAGPAAVTYVGSVNSDIENGKIKAGAPKSQLYNLATDPNQTKNVVLEHPEIAAKMQMRLDEIKGSNSTRP